MEGHLILFVLSCLFCGACSLSCHQCLPSGPGPCTDTKTECPPTTQCGSLRVVASAGGNVMSDMIMKTCVMPKQCITGSVNVGLMKTVINSKCCQTDNCNAQPAPASTGGPNGKECYTCNGPDCSSKMKCEGVEDRCITANLNLGEQKMPVKGCASKSICAGEMADQLGQSFEGMTCCEGNLCNGGSKSRSSGGTNNAATTTRSRSTVIATVLSLACVLFFP